MHNHRHTKHTDILRILLESHDKGILKLGTKKLSPPKKGHPIICSHYQIDSLFKNTLPHIY